MGLAGWEDGELSEGAFSEVTLTLSRATSSTGLLGDEVGRVHDGLPIVSIRLRCSFRRVRGSDVSHQATG